MASNRLTDAAIKKAIHSAQRTVKRTKLADGEGLYLLIEPRPDAAFWRQKYRFGGLEKVLAHGSYPAVSLRRAREKRAEARLLLDQEIDPGAHRKAKRRAAKFSMEDTFSAVAEEWFAHYRTQRELANQPLAPSTIEKAQWLLYLREYREKKQKGEVAHPLRGLSSRAIRSISRDDIAHVINGLKVRGKIETAHRLLDRLERVFRYAVGTGRGETNAAAAFRDSTDPRDKLPSLKVRNHPGITDPRKFGGLLRAIDGYSGQPVTQYALKIAPYLFVRPIELRKACWSEFDLEDSAPTWRIPITKMRKGLIVPLAPQVVSILEQLHSLTGPDGLVFPSTVDTMRPISENTVTAALRRMGYSGEEMTWHGFRTSASTLLRELGWDDELVERQLSHEYGSDSKKAYDKSKLLPARRTMMQEWADYLDRLKRRNSEAGDIAA